MANPIFRFTLSHDVAGTLEISEPDGWKDCKLKLDREPEFHSLVEYFDGKFIFYGDNGVENGGIDFIRFIEQTYGIDAALNITIEASVDSGNTYTTVFIGLLDLDGIEEFQNNKLQCPIIRNDFWSKFVSRYETPVDLQSSTDLDGNPVTVIDHVNITLTNQKLPQKHYDFNTEGTSIWEAPAINHYIQGTGDSVTLDEVEEFYTLYIAINDELPVSNSDIKYAGEYTFNLRYELSMWVRLDLMPIPTPVLKPMTYSGGGHFVDYYLTVNEVFVQQFNTTEYTPNANKQSTVYTLSSSVFLKAGDQVRIYGKIKHNLPTTDSEYGGGGIPMLSSIVVWGDVNNNVTIFHSAGFEDWNLYALSALDGTPSQTTRPTFIDVEGQTEFPETSGQCFFLHDAANEILTRIIGEPTPLYSEYLGSAETISRQYPDEGCAWKYVLLKGLQIRDYSLTEKPFSLSFKEWWTGANPILNLSLGYSVFGSDEVIEIGTKEDHYSETIIVNIDYVESIQRKYDPDYIFNKIDIGYNKWQSEDISGIDDPQTKHTYASILKRAGKGIALISTYIAASLSIEATRRKTKEKSTDYKYDNDTFIIAINPDDVSPDRYLPELDENYDSVTGLLNEETRYNLRLTPLRNFLRWINVLSGCLQSYPSSEFKFVSGEGNFDMASQLTAGDPCETYFTNLSEKQNIAVSSNHLFIPMLYEIEGPMSLEQYLSIRDNKKNAIGISQTDSNHQPFFIKTLEYEICKSKCKITAWPKTYFEITNTDFVPPTITCDPNYRITEDSENRLTEDGEIRITE